MKKSGVVSIIGRPNAGKSTLLNRAMDASLSIVTPKAQTTRQQLKGILTDPKMGQIVFVDTPGVHQLKKNNKELNQYMLRQVEDSIQSADLIWYLVDPRATPDTEKKITSFIKKEVGIPVFVIFTKKDLGVLYPASLKTFIQKELKNHTIFFYEVSAQEDLNIHKLMKDTWGRIPNGEWLYPQSEDLSDRPTKYFVGEQIQKQLFLNCEQEIPYSCAVQVNEFKEEKEITRILATIFVEKESQKGIVIGKNASKLKQVGTLARKEIENFLDHKVYLQLKVKVFADWSKKKPKLRELGYIC